MIWNFAVRDYTEIQRICLAAEKVFGNNIESNGIIYLSRFYANSSTIPRFIAVQKLRG